MRCANLNRRTNETNITVNLVLDGSGTFDNDTGIGFFNHMLDQFARHGLFNLAIKAKADLHVDDHHCVEDVGIILGQALESALADKAGIRRYGSCLLPMDDALVQIALDLSGRSYFYWDVTIPTEKIGQFDTELIREFFQAFATHAKMTLHVKCIHGVNSHHIVEASFKAVARALRQAIEIDPRASGDIPSTKGTL